MTLDELFYRVSLHGFDLIVLFLMLIVWLLLIHNMITEFRKK